MSVCSKTACKVCEKGMAEIFSLVTVLSHVVVWSLFTTPECAHFLK